MTSANGLAASMFASTVHEANMEHPPRDLTEWDRVTRLSIGEATCLMVGRDPCLEKLSQEQFAQAAQFQYQIQSAVSYAARVAWFHARVLDDLTIYSKSLSLAAILRTVEVWDIFYEDPSCLPSLELIRSVEAVSSNPEGIPILLEVDPWYTATVVGQDLNRWLQSNGHFSVYSFQPTQRIDVVTLSENWSARENRRAGGFQGLSVEAVELAKEAQQYCHDFYDYFNLETRFGPANAYFGQMNGDDSGIDSIAYELASFDHSEWLLQKREIDLDASMPLLRLIWADAASALYLSNETGDWNSMWSAANKAIRWMSVLKGIELMSDQGFLSASGSEIGSIAENARARGRVTGLASRIGLYAEARRWIWSKWLQHAAEYKHIKSRFARDYCRLIAYEFAFADGSGLTVSINTITQEWLRGPPSETACDVESATPLEGQPTEENPRAFWRVV